MNVIVNEIIILIEYIVRLFGLMEVIFKKFVVFKVIVFMLNVVMNVFVKFELIMVEMNVW